MFLALEPDARLCDLIWTHKRRVASLVGPQVFLDHPPHLTLYLAAFADEPTLCAAAEQLARENVSVTAQIVGWHVFWSDRLTGRHTLVCQLDDATIEQLRGLQSRLIQRFAPLRDTAATVGRYAKRVNHLSNEERASIARTGFPYTGNGWHPHLTIGSIAVSDWPTIEREVLPDAPRCKASLATLACYRLVNEHPAQIATFPLSASTASPRPVRLAS